MVLPPTAILGAISTCEGFLKEICGILGAIKNCPKDVHKIKQNFSLSQRMLPRFFTFFKAHEESIPKDISSDIANITNSLNGKLQYLVGRMNAMKDGRSWRRLTWHWAKDDLAGAEQELALWVMKIHALAQCLPPVMRNDLYNAFVSEEFRSNNSPLTTLLAGLEMRKKLDEAEDRSLDDLRHLKGEAPSYAPGSVHFDSDKWVIARQYARRPDEQKRIEADVARLVSLLHDSNAGQMHLPKASLYSSDDFKAQQQTFTVSLGLHYETPTDVTSITSLKHAIKNNTKHSLTDRIRVARETAAGIAYLHAVGWVHKGLHSNRIMLCRFPGHNARLSLGSVAVLGFSFSRRSAVKASSFNPDIDDNWESEIYKHPDRQAKRTDTLEGLNELRIQGDGHGGGAPAPGDILRFEKMHDVYSLGVVLLEIGLWQDVGHLVEGLEQAKPEKRNEDLLSVAEELLPMSMGHRFTRIVRHCLKVTDNEDMTAGQVLECLEDLVL